MNQNKLGRLRTLLHNRIPLVGWSLRRMAARQLAGWANPAAIRLLAEAVTTLTDPKIHATALKAIEEISNQAAIDAVIETWLNSRSAVLEERVLRHGWIANKPPLARAFSALKSGRMEVITQGRGELAEPLLALCEDSDIDAARDARKCLFNLSGRYIIDAVCALWAETRHPILEEAVLHAGYTARAPGRVQILTRLKIGQVEGLEESGPAQTVEIALACEDPDPVISANAEVVLGRLVDPGAQQEVCRLILEKEQERVIRAGVRGGYLPDEENDRALFLFLTNQWAEYEVLDFDRQRLRLFYEAGDQSLRERITRQVRSSGRPEFLNIIVGRSFQGRIDGMSEGELENLVQLLVEQKRFELLWGLVFRLPLRWSQLAVVRLRECGWQPDASEDNSVYQQLKGLARTEILQDEFRFTDVLPPAVLRSRAHLSQGRINDVAFSPTGTRLAMGTSRRKVVLWDFQQAELANVIDGFNHSIGSTTFTNEGKLILGERTSSIEETCAVYGWDGQKADILYQGHGSVTTAAAFGDEKVLAALRDHKVVLVDLKGEGKPLVRSFGFWARSVCVSGGQEHAALIHHGIDVLSLPQLQDTAKSTTWSQVARTACFFPGDDRVAVGLYNGEVCILQGRQLKLERQPLVEHTGPVSGTAVLKDYPLLISAGAEGIVRFTNWETRIPFGSLGRMGDKITALKLSPDESFMAVGHADASVSLYDLRTLELPRLLEKPFDLARPNQLAAVRALLQDGRREDYPEFVGQALEYTLLVLQHRFRFDIELDGVPEIKPGEYEIEIEPGV